MVDKENLITDEKYVRLTTFTKDGRPKHTPVWIAHLHNGELGTTTDDDSLKVKRLRNTPKVELTVSDAKCKVDEGIDSLSGSAKVVGDNEEEYSDLEAAFINKYGIQYRLFRFIRKLRRKRPCGIVITLN